MKNTIRHHGLLVMVLTGALFAGGVHGRQEGKLASIDLEMAASEAKHARELAQRCVEEFSNALSNGDAGAAMKQVGLPFALDRKKLLSSSEELQAIIAMMAQKMKASGQSLHVADIRIAKRIEDQCMPVYVAFVTTKVGQGGDSVLLCVDIGTSASICGLSD